MGHVRRAPRVNNGIEVGYVSVIVSSMRPDDATFWHNRVQPLIARTNEDRADKKWDWRFFRRVLPLTQRLQGRRCLALATLAKNDAGEAVPVAMHLMIERYPHLRDHTSEATFLWFMSAMPKDAYVEFHISGQAPSLGYVCVDVALTASQQLGLQGRIGLHCAPAGLDRLFNFYVRAGLENLPKEAPMPMYHVNDGRYFYSEPEMATGLLSGLDHLRCEGDRS